MGLALRVKFKRAYNTNPAYHYTIKLLFPDGRDAEQNGARQGIDFIQTDNLLYHIDFNGA